MKVLDIICETTPAAAPSKEAEIIANWLKNNPHLEVVEKYDPAVANFATKWIAENKFANAEIMKAFEIRYGLAFGFLKTIGLIGPMVLCGMHLRAIEELSKQKDASGKPLYTTEYLEKQENAVVGTFLASQIVGIVYKSIRSGLFISALRSLLTGLAMRSPGGARVMIAALIGEQVALAALQTWLNTADGIEWCTHTFIIQLIVGGLGSLGNNFLEFLRIKVKDTTGKELPQITPNLNQRKEKEKADTGEPSSDDIAKWEKDWAAKTDPIKTVPR